MKLNFQVSPFKSTNYNTRVASLHTWYSTIINSVITAELANSYKKLLNEKKAIELVLRKNSHLESFADVEAFEAHLRNLNMKDEVNIL